MRLLRTLLSLLLLSLPVLAWADGTQFTGQCALLAWDANLDQDLAGYRLYDRVSLANTPTQVASLGNAITSVPCSQFNFNAGQHYVSLSTFDTSGNESARTPEIPFVIVANAVTDLAVTTINSTDVVLSFTEVDDGTGSPASYQVRFATPTINWGTAADVSSGTCAVPLAGTSIGSTKTCTVTGLSVTTPYQFQLVPYRGTLGTNAVFGPLSNIASGTTGGSPPAPTDRVTYQSDGFGRADGALGQFWDDGYVKPTGAVGALAIVSNRARGTTLTQDSMETFNDLALPDDQWAQVTATTFSGSGCITVRLLLHYSPPPDLDGYELIALKGCAGITAYIAKRASGVFASLASESATTWASTDVLRAEYRNGTLTLYRNDVALLSAVDSTFPSGRAGLGLSASASLANAEATAWSAGGFVATTADVCGCDNH